MRRIPFRSDGVTRIGCAPMVGVRVQSLPRTDALDGTRFGLDVGDDLEPRMCGAPRLSPRAKALDDRCIHLNPARTVHVRLPRARALLERETTLALRPAQALSAWVGKAVPRHAGASHSAWPLAGGASLDHAHD